jgi:hypothetical protein|tara:strand:- start:1105 stop:1248 length:144 start_codon:yes stop_codon:yes gene_type:complete
MSLNSKEWQLLLILKELEYQLSDKEKEMKVIEWLQKRKKELGERSGW